MLPQAFGFGWSGSPAQPSLHRTPLGNMRRAQDVAGESRKRCRNRRFKVQRPLQITFKGMDSSPALEALIRQRVDHLQTLYPRLVGCRVVVETPHRASETAKVPIAISVEADVPGRGPVIAKDEEYRRESKQDHTAAVNNAFDAVERQLERIGDL